MAGEVELYRRYRPTRLRDVVGQDDVIKSLMDMGKRNAIPHFLLFQGASGTGKTTVARIIAAMMKCTGSDFTEVNAAESRGIDMVREIIQTYNMSALGGGVRVYLIDEAQSLTADAQSSFLKPLEDPPAHAYFFFCTTDPQKLKKTIITRATTLTFVKVRVDLLQKLVIDVADKEGVSLREDVVLKIAEAADGSARKALVFLHAVLKLPDPAAQLAAIVSTIDSDSSGFKLAQMICRRGAAWQDVAALLKTLDTTGEEPEMTRRVVLGYCRSILLSGKSDPHIIKIMEEFRDDYFQTGNAGLALSCYHAVH